MDAILLVDHGSRRAEANEKLEELSLALGAHLAALGQTVLVTHAHMELAEPSIAAAVASSADRGVTSLVCVPCFLARGRHVSEDIPRQLAAALASHPQVSFRMAAPLSEQPGFLELLARAGGH